MLEIILNKNQKPTQMKIKFLLFMAIVLGFQMVQAAKHVITQSGFTFTPNLITVNIGDTIRWVWSDGVHTTTNKNIPAGAASWDSPLTASNPSFEYVVTLPGEYEYMCSIHESMGMTGKFQTPGSTGIEANSLNIPEGLWCYTDSKVIRLFSQSPASFSGTISIYDVAGKNVYETSAAFSGGNSQLTISDAALPKGLYILRLLTDQKKTLSVKFYVQ